MIDPFYIRVKVKTEQKNDSLTETGNHRFEVSVKEKGERNMANQKVIDLLNTHFNNPVGGIHIINGHHSPTKLLKVGK